MRRMVIGLLAATLAVASCSSDGSRGGGPAPDPSTSSSSAARGADPAAVPAQGSVGCTGAAAVAGETKETMTSRGEERWYYRRVPPGYDGTEPMPLVLDFHGYSEGAAIHLQMSNLGAYGDEQGFITVTPQGLGAVARWDTELGGADLAFVGDLMDRVEAELCVDTNRMFSTGLSNGGFLTSAIACEYSDRIAAVAPVAGARTIEGCEVNRPVPVVAFHGTDDGFVDYEGGMGEDALDLPAPDGSGKTLRDTVTAEQIERSVDSRQSIPRIMAAWAKRNGCGSQVAEREVGADVTELRWDCAADATTELYRVTGGGHTWPGSSFSAALENIMGPTTTTVSANEVMWEFFQAHPLGL